MFAQHPPGPRPGRDPDDSASNEGLSSGGRRAPGDRDAVGTDSPLATRHRMPIGSAGRRARGQERNPGIQPRRKYGRVKSSLAG